MTTQIIPAYIRIRQYLVQRISTGSAGDRIPSEKELCKIFGVTRPTVRAALKELTASGELAARKGIGVFITKDPVSPAGETVGVITGNGCYAIYPHIESLILSGILSGLPERGLCTTFLRRAESREQFPLAVKELGLKGVLWVAPDLALLRIFRRTCPDIKIVAAASCADASRKNPPPDRGIVDGYAVWDVFDETLRIGRHFLSKGMRKIVWITPALKDGKDDFDGYIRGFDAACEERGLDPGTVWSWIRQDKITQRKYKEIFSGGPVGIYNHQHFFAETNTFALENGLVFGKDYRMLIRGCFPNWLNSIARDTVVFDYKEIGFRAAHILASLLKAGPDTEMCVKFAPDITEFQIT